MFEKRPFLLGLGIGLMAGAILLQLMLIGREQSERLSDIDRLVGEEPLYTQAELDARIAEAEQRVRRELGETARTEGSFPEQSADDAEDADGGAADPAAGADSEDGGTPGAGDGMQQGGTSAEPEGKPGDAQPIHVRIKPGMTLTETADLLESAGVIDDAEALRELMARMSTRIRAGYYEFQGGETLEDVQRILTTPPQH